MDLSGVFSEPGDPQGVLSTSIFSGYALTFDYGRGQVRVQAGALPEANGTDVFHCGTGIPKVPLTIAGNEVNVNLDTGARSGFNLPAGFMEKLPLEGDPMEIGRARTVDAKVSILGANLRGEVKLGRFTFTNPKIGFVPGAPIGTLGAQILSDFVFSVDHANQHVRFEPSSSSGTKAASKPVRYGMLFRGINGEEMIVAGVDPDSPAEHGGIQEGDTITALNGIQLSELGRDDRIQALRTSPLSITVHRGDEKLHLELRLE